MISLTTRQRDILRIILEIDRTIGSVELADRLNITPRQVNYSMKGVRLWLKQHGQECRTQPGAGFSLSISPETSRILTKEIITNSDIQIILSISQRQQLLALFLLASYEPFILSQLQQKVKVSRVTILNDLDPIERWLNGRQISLIRKPNFGIQVLGNEQNCQRAIAEILWGETPFSSDPITRITHADGLVFNLESDAQLLPLADYVNKLLAQVNIHRTIGLVAKAEEQLEGRFTDDAVLHLALKFAILARRVVNNHHLDVDEQTIHWLQSLTIWPVASFIANRLSKDSNSTWLPTDISGIAMDMMAAHRAEIMPGEIEPGEDFSNLINRLMEYISQAFGISKLKHDHTLQNGLRNYILPACFRQRFNLWYPESLSKTAMPEQYERENEIAQATAQMVYEHTRFQLPQSEINNLVVLLRAAYIRNRTYRFEHIIVVCPSGMATAQLLVARLNARFPYLNPLEVVSLRSLTPALVMSADLILTTVPLPRQFTNNPKVIQVHPLLMPEDIETITQFLS